MTHHLHTSTSPLAHVGLTTVTHPVTSCDFPHFVLETTAASMLQWCMSTKSATWAGVGRSHLFQGEQPLLPVHSARNPSPTFVQQRSWLSWDHCTLQLHHAPRGHNWGFCKLKAAATILGEARMRTNVQIASTGCHRRLKMPCTFNKSQSSQKLIDSVLLTSYWFM